MVDGGALAVFGFAGPAHAAPVPAFSAGGFVAIFVVVMVVVVLVPVAFPLSLTVTSIIGVSPPAEVDVEDDGAGL